MSFLRNPELLSPGSAGMANFRPVQRLGGNRRPSIREQSSLSLLAYGAISREKQRAPTLAQKTVADMQPSATSKTL